MITWIREYLSLRSQYVVVNGAESGVASVTSGVPQGSVLGPLLFLIFINDLPDTIASSIRLFADDLIIYREVTSVADTVILQSDLAKIENWCRESQMQINVQKTVHMRFTKKRMAPTPYNLSDSPLQTVSEYKYLGVFFTPPMCCHRHVNFITAKAYKALGFLRRNTKLFPQQTRDLLYKSYVRPILEYGCTVWDPPTNADCEESSELRCKVRYR